MKLNPLGQVPCLQVEEDKLIPESLINCDYLEAAFPDKKPLKSADPYTNAQHSLIAESFNGVIGAFYKFSRKTEKDADKILIDALDNNVVKKLKTKFFGGLKKKFIIFFCFFLIRYFYRLVRIILLIFEILITFLFIEMNW